MKLNVYGPLSPRIRNTPRKCATRFTRMRREALRLTGLFLVFWVVVVSSALADCETVGVGRGKDGFAQFSLGTQRYLPIGVNYFHLHQGPPYPFSPSTLSTLANLIRRIIEDAFSRMKESGYNYVRLFLSGFSPDRGFDRDDRGIGEDYLENIRRAMRLADKFGLHVVLTGLFRAGQWLPRNYLPHVNDSAVGGINRLLLVPQYPDDLASFYRDLLIGLRAKEPHLLSCIFYLDLYNELQFDINQPPFSSQVGKFSFDGTDYDLATQNRGNIWLMRLPIRG